MQAVVHHVGGVRAHARFGAAVFAEAGAGFVGRVAERAVAIVEYKKFRCVSLAMKMSVQPSPFRSASTTAEALAVGVRQAGLFGDVGERAVAVVVIQRRGRTP